MNWKVRAITNTDDSIWNTWDTLCHDHHNGNPMLDSRFVTKLMAFFPQEIYCACALDENEEIEAILLLFYKGNAVWQTYKPSQSQVSLIVMKKGVNLCLDSLLQSLPKLCLKLDLMSLDPREHSELISRLHPEQLLVSANNIVVNVEGGFDDYWAARNKKLKSNVKRYINRIENSHTYKLNIKSSAEEVKLGVSQYGLLESRGWKGEIGTALHPGNSQGEFYTTLMEDFSLHGNAKVFELVLDGEVVASRLCVFSESVMIMLKTTYEESFKKYAVGRILLYLVIQHVFENRLSKVIDFYTNANRDQLEWSSCQRDIVSASYYKYGWINYIVPAIKSFKEKLKGY